jgi:hypothetical protein
LLTTYLALRPALPAAPAVVGSAISIVFVIQSSSEL